MIERLSIVQEVATQQYYEANYVKKKGGGLDKFLFRCKQYEDLHVLAFVKH